MLHLPHRRALLNTKPPIQTTADIWLDGTDWNTMFQERSSPATISGVGGVIGTWRNKGTLGASANFTASTDAQRPIYRSSTYAEFDGLDDGMRTADGILNTGTVSYLIAFQKTNTNRVICGQPQAAAAHTNPFFRTVLFTITNTLEARLNGTQLFGTATVSDSVNYVAEFYSADGDTFVNGTRDINASGATLTYPNSVPFLLFQNAAGGEPAAGRCYGLLAFSRDLSTEERAEARKYLGNLAGLSL